VKLALSDSIRSHPYIVSCSSLLSPIFEINRIMAASERKALVIGVSGASSSGKTTLSRLIRDLFPNTFVLHEDDFYKPEKE